MSTERNSGYLLLESYQAGKLIVEEQYLTISVIFDEPTSSLFLSCPFNVSNFEGHWLAFLIEKKKSDFLGDRKWIYFCFFSEQAFSILHSTAKQRFRSEFIGLCGTDSELITLIKRQKGILTIPFYPSKGSLNVFQSH